MLFFTLLGFAFGNYRDLLNFVQRARRPDSDVHAEIEPHEYHELIIPHSAVGKVMDKFFADYMNSHRFNPLVFIDRVVEDSLGGLVPVSILPCSQEFEFRDLKVFFDGSKALRLEYYECFKEQKKGGSPVNCFKKLINERLEGVSRQHARSAFFFLELTKRIAEPNRMTAFHPPFRIQVEKDYLKDLYKYLRGAVPHIANDRISYIPEVLYAYSMFRYIYHQALFLGKTKLAQAVFGSIKALQKMESIYNYSFLQTEYLPTPYRITVRNQIHYVDTVVALGVFQRQRLENEVMHIYFKESTMYVSFSQYYRNAAVSFIKATAKKFLLGDISLTSNPLSFPIS